MAVSVFRSKILSAAVIVLGLAAAIGVSGFIERHRPALDEGYSDSDLQVRGAGLKGYALGMEGLVADWYYMRSLQYIGYKVMNSKDEFIDLENLTSLNPRLLYPMIDTATDLDPHFTAAYTYGALLLPAIDTDKALLIAQKAIDNNPDHWRFYQYMGYIYWKLERYPEAAEVFERGSHVQGAAPFMKMMSAAMQTEGGSRSTARAVFQQMYTDSDDAMVKLTAERSLANLDWLDQREAIDHELAEHKEKTGSCPSSLAEIVPGLMGVKLPADKDFSLDSSGKLVDPTGAPYLLDRDACRVKLDFERTGLPKQK